MVDRAQAFILEGVAASLLLLVATYAIFQSSLVISPMWSELGDAQLKQTGYDALRILDGNGTYNDSLKGMLTRLNSSFKPNDEFLASLEKLVYPANYRLELYWVNLTIGKIHSKVLVDNEPTPEAIAASRIVVLTNGDLSSSSPFYIKDSPPHIPVAIEVRLILWKV